jgi:C4-dicarboxylate-specific signal transduction histidine kinase
MQQIALDDMRNPPAWLAGPWGSLDASTGSLHDWQATSFQAPRAMTTNELIASIAHEVNQPLAAIVANADACLSCLGADQPDLARLRKAARRILRDGYRASAVLSSTRAVLENPVPAMSELDLNEIIRDILDVMRNELSWYDVILQIELCKQLGCIRGNRIQLQQVLRNLIKNAIESMIDSVVRPLLVRVSTAIQGELALVAVEDSGGGFDAVAAEHMFEPFFTTKRNGTGVGLSICRSIVEAHGGVLCATRKESAGSVFQFTVPLSHPPISIQN